MHALRIFGVSSLFTYRALFQWLNPSAYIFSKTLMPILQMTFFTIVGAYGGARPLEFYVVGNAILVAYRPMFTIATSIGNERREGTLPYIVASPAERVPLFFGRSTFHILDGLIDVVIAFGYAVLVFGLDLSNANWAGVTLAVLVATIGASTVGMAMGALAYLLLDAVFLANAAMFTLLLLSGANIPLEDLPGWLQALSWTFPITGCVEAVRAYADGAELGSKVALIARDLVVGVVWAVGALGLFQWIEAQARRRGTLEGM